MISIQDLVSFIEGLVVIFAGVAGGIWAVYKYFSHLQAAPEIDLQIEQINNIKKLCILNANLTIHNHGNRNLYIDLTTAKCDIKRASFDNNNIIFNDVNSFKPWPTHEYIVRSHSTMSSPFLCQVPEPGVYFIDLRFDVSPQESRISNRIKCFNSNHNDWQWRTCKISIVKSC